MEELLGKKTPYSAPAEQAVVGSMLIDPRCIPEVLEKLKADEFYIKLNRDIYETMYTMSVGEHGVHGLVYVTVELDIKLEIGRAHV